MYDRLPIPYYIVPQTKIYGVYEIQELICIAIILFLIISSLFEFKNWVKALLTGIALFITVLHYYILYVVSIYESIIIYPLIIIETNRLGYSTITIDFGQLMILSIILLWRDKVVYLIKQLIIRIKRV